MAVRARRWFRAVAAGAALLLAGCASQPKIADVIQARALSDRGLDQFNAGDYQGALKTLDAVIAYGSRDDRDYTRRAAALGALKQYDRALADTDKALALAPHEWRTHLQRAYFHQRLGQIEPAIGDLNAALSEEPDREELVRQRAYLEVVAARFDDAIGDYATLARLAPRSPTGPTGRGVALYMKGAWREAARAFERILADDGSDGLSALWLVKAASRAGLPLDPAQFAGRPANDPSWVMAGALLTAETPDQARAKIAPLAQRGVSACEQYLFAGAWRIIHNASGAAEEFAAAERACPKDSIEVAEARAERARLER